MKKTLLLILCARLLTLSLCALPGCKNETPDAPSALSSGAVSELPGALLADWQEGGLSVTVEIPSAAGKECSLLLLKTAADLETWEENSESVLALTQITLDADGKGEALLPTEATAGYLVVTAGDARLTMEK